MQTVLAAVAELERETIAERVQSGRLARALTWAARYGASSACGARGAILQAIATTLDAAGLPTPRGGQHWHPSTVHGISENRSTGDAPRGETTTPRRRAAGGCGDDGGAGIVSVRGRPSVLSIHRSTPHN